MPPTTSNIGTARNYLRAIGQFATGDALAQFFDPQVVQEQFPNRLLPNGSRCGLEEMLRGAERRQKLPRSQSHQIHHELGGHCVALEVTWLGTLEIPFQNLAAGASMRARLAGFFEFRDGRIVAQRNYGCFDPR
jgi:ketosteroid isomerase-like protein